MNQRRYRKTLRSLEHIEQIPNIVQTISQIFTNVQSIKQLSERSAAINGNGTHSVSVDLERGIPEIP